MINLNMGMKAFPIFFLILSTAVGAGTDPNNVKNVDVAPAPTTNSLPSRSKATGASTTDVGKVQLSLTWWKGTNWLAYLRPTVITDETGVVFLVMPGGTVYVGEMRDGKPNGQGTITSVGGTHQWGEFRDGLSYRLTGRWVGPGGLQEEGTWNLDGTKCGGTIRWKDGRVYTGDWVLVDGAPEVPSGMGTMTWPDGNVYVGAFLKGKMDGKGKMTNPRGIVKEGLWKRDQFVGPSPP
jgi:hypothetical protein